MPVLRWPTSLVLLAVIVAQGASQEPPAAAGFMGLCAEAGRCRAGWTGGAEALVLVPRFESNPAYFVSRRTTLGPGLPPINSQYVEEFGYAVSVSPRVWLGYSLDSGIGGRVRWFHFDQQARARQAVNPALPLGSPVAFQSISSTSPLMAIAPQTALPAVNSIQAPSPFGVEEQLGFSSGLYLDMWDIEATFSDLHTGNWDFALFGGVRFARIEQSYNAFSQGLATQFLTSRQTYDGIGPTFGLEGSRRLGTSGFSFYGVGRISFLFGKDEHVASGLNIGLVPEFTYAFHDNASSRERIMPVIEVEMGVEGAYPVGAVEAVARTGVFSQLVPLGSGANGNGNAGLIGLSVSAGFRF